MLVEMSKVRSERIDGCLATRAKPQLTAITGAIKDPARRQEAVDFFRDEYTLDRTIALMKKPVISFMDGATSMSSIA